VGSSAEIARGVRGATLGFPAVPLNIWDGERALTPRVVLAQHEIASRGLRLRFATEQIDAETDWCCFDDSRHLIYVHRQGAVRSMETMLDWGPMGSGPPRVGDVWVVPAGQRCATVVQGGEPAAYCEIAIPLRAVGNDTLMPRARSRDPLLYHLTDRLFNVAGRDDAMAWLLKDSLVEALRLHVADTCTAIRPPRRRRGPGRDALDPAVRTLIVEYLEDALDADITLEALADLANMTVSRFIKAFAAAFHTTPYQYLLDRRIDRAKSLLVTTSRTIGEISVAVGFSTPNHFATAFKRRVGMSPSRYRNNA
jgi:AraC family transcriptional regulator